MTTTPAPAAAVTEFKAIDPLLRTLTGDDYETAPAPSLLLNRVTADDTAVYSWSPRDYATPCMAWHSPRGWSAAVVDTETDGWPNDMWYSRARDLGSAILCAPEPTSLMTLLRQVLIEAAAPHDNDYRAKQRSLAWGLVMISERFEARTGAYALCAEFGIDITGQGLLDSFWAEGLKPEKEITAADLLITSPPAIG